MPGALSLTLFGGFDGRLSSGPLPPLAKKTQALLAYLALEGATPRARSELASLLWGDTGDEQALQSLRKALSLLRQTLGADADQILVVQERSVGLNRSAVTVDVLEFERLVRTGDPASLVEGTTIYRGHLLAGLDVDETPFNEWLLSRRERLRELALNALGRVLDQQIESNAVDAAVDTASRVLSLDPLHEPAHRALIQLYARQGRRAAAVRQYQQCTEALKRELGIAPDAETEAAYQNAIANPPFSAPQAPHAPQAPQAPSFLPSVYARGKARPIRLRHLAAAAVLLVAVSVAVAMLAIPRRPLAASTSSLAVLPLANLSNDPAYDYLSEGVTEALIHDLSQIKALRVISRTSVMRYKGTTLPIGSIARELGVDLVMEGTIQQSADRLRITLQLIEAATDRHVLSRTFETTAGQVFDTQRRIARDVAREVAVQVTPSEQARLDEQPTVDAEAYRNYLLGRFFWNKRSVADLRTALEHYQRAVTIDPTFAGGHAGLALTYYLLGDEEFAGMPIREASPLAQAAAARALELDPNSVEARTALAMTLFFFEWKWHEAEAEFKRAIEANPGYATAHSWYGWLQIARGHFDEAIALMNKARDLDPLSPVVATASATAYQFARRYTEALARYDEALKLNPDYPGAHIGRARIFAATGRLAEAREIFETALEHGFDVRLLIGAASLQGLMGDKAGAKARLNEIRGTNQLLPSVMRAQLLFALDDDAAAYQALSDAVDERSSNLLMMFPSPSVDSRRHDPRFKAIVDRVNPELQLLGERASASR